MALDGTTSLFGDYLRDHETGAAYIVQQNVNKTATTRVVPLLAPYDVDDGVCLVSPLIFLRTD
jgi:hypothetical protein